jgi:predicted nucleic acid-binding protein
VIVVDTNVLAYLFIQGIHTPSAEALLVKEPQWVAPILWRNEFRNILAGYIRRGDVSFDGAYKILREAESLLAGNEYEPDSLQVLELVRDSECTAYDCEFVAVAMALNAKLVTMDKALLKAFPKVAVRLSSS